MCDGWLYFGECVSLKVLFIRSTARLRFFLVFFSGF
jgi:hypothetical protein